MGSLCERTVRAEAKPAPALAVSCIRGTLELARGHDGDALAAFRTAERLAGPWPPCIISSTPCRYGCCRPWCASAS